MTAPTLVYPNDNGSDAQTTITRFKCSYEGCGKSFKRADYLTRHASTHKEVRPHRCERCNISFTRRDLLLKHLKSKTHRNGPEKHQIFVDYKSGEPKAKKLKTRQTSSAPISEPPPHSDDNPNVMRSGRFSNLTNAKEDSFCWLFGEDVIDTNFLETFVAEEHVKRQSEMPSPSNHHNGPTEDQQDHTTTITDETIQRMQIYLTHVVRLQDNVVLEAFSREAISSYLFNYWSDFDTIYPIIHRGTFETSVNDPKLSVTFLLSILTIGMSLQKNHDMRNLSIEIQNHIRSEIYNKIDTLPIDITVMPLQLLQSLLLCNTFYMYYGDQSQQAKFRIFYPLAINLFKELRLYVDLTEPKKEDDTFTDDYWHEWIRYETLKRLALFGYALDTQCSLFQLSTPSISLFHIQIDMPYTDSVWLAPTIEVFVDEYRKLPRDFVERAHRESDKSGYGNARYHLNTQDIVFNGNLIPNVKAEGKWPNFLWSLRRLLQPFSDYRDKEYHYDCFSQFSRFILLHGVLALVRELRTTNFVFSDLQGVVSQGKLNTVAAKIEQGLFSWRSYFQVNIAKSNEISTTRDSEESAELMNIYDTSPVFWANITLHHAGLLGLYCDFPMIHRYTRITLSSGTENSTQQAQSPGKLKFNAIEITKTKLLVQTWAQSKDGEHSVVQACSLLRTVFTDEGLVPKIPHLPVVMYLAALVCWSYHRNTRPTRSHKLVTANTNNQQFMKNEAQKYIAAMLMSEGESLPGTPNPFTEAGDDDVWLSLKYLILNVATVLRNTCAVVTSDESLYGILVSVADTF